MKKVEERCKAGGSAVGPRLGEGTCPKQGWIQITWGGPEHLKSPHVSPGGLGEMRHSTCPKHAPYCSPPYTQAARQIISRESGEEGRMERERQRLWSDMQGSLGYLLIKLCTVLPQAHLGPSEPQRVDTGRTRNSRTRCLPFPVGETEFKAFK